MSQQNSSPASGTVTTVTTQTDNTSTSQTPGHTDTESTSNQTTPTPIVRAPLVSAWGVPSTSTFGATSTNFSAARAGSSDSGTGPESSASGGSFGAFGSSSFPSSGRGLFGAFGGGPDTNRLGLNTTGGSVGAARLSSVNTASVGQSQSDHAAVSTPATTQQAVPSQVTQNQPASSSNTTQSDTPSTGPEKEPPAPVSNTVTTGTSEKPRRRKGKEPAQASGSATTKPRAKRGDWRVEGYSSNVAIAPAPPVQPPTNGPYSSSFRAKMSSNRNEPAAADVAPAMDSRDPGKGKDSRMSSPKPAPVQRSSETERRSHVVSPPPRLPPPSSSTQHIVDLTNDRRGSHDTDMYDISQPRDPYPIAPSYAPMGVDPVRDSGHQRSQSQSSTYPSSSATKEPPRLVTLLIEDIRGQMDPQLVELRLGTILQAGRLWVNALDVSRELQQGASRIDG